MIPSDGKQKLEARLREAASELERRLRAGEDGRAEVFFQSDPDLASHIDTALDLIYREYTTREALGQHPLRQGFYERFPQYREGLERQFQVHDLLGAADAKPTVRIPGSHLDTRPDEAETTGGPWRAGYDILDLIGHGGTSYVFKARQRGLKRLVALKMLKTGVHATAEEIRRFRGDAEKMSSLHHPNIVQVWGVDERDGVPSFAMEYMDGGTLTQRIGGQPHDPTKAAEWVGLLARAVHHAHQQKVVHRDLKPANVLFTADGTVKLTDFGLAKKLESGTQLTSYGAIIGTPGYIAPEQIAAGGKDPTISCDIYGLGAILYELLTGQPPYRGETMLETIQMTERGDPPPPHRFNPNVDRGLEAICVKCMERQPRYRYATAGELADDLAVWQEGQKPPPARWPARMKRFTRRHRFACATVAAVLCVAAIIPLWRHFGSPEHRYQAMLDTLAAGRQVTVIGERGRPPVPQFIVSDDFSSIEQAEDGSFQVKSSGPSLLELFHEIPCSNYRVKLQIRHEPPRLTASQIGVYFGRELITQDKRDAQLLWTVLLTGPYEVDQSGKAKVTLAQRVAYGPVLIDAGTGIPDERMSEHEKIFIHYLPDGTWLNLAVSVIGGQVTIECEGQTHHFTAEGILKERQEEAPNGPWYDPGPINPRGGLGLYVRYGTASFRKIVVEPLPDADPIQ
jgi:serine/threonine-protein kinase